MYLSKTKFMIFVPMKKITVFAALGFEYTLFFTRLVYACFVMFVPLCPNMLTMML